MAMNKPELFNLMQRQTHDHTKHALDNDFLHLLNWRKDKKDSWLDIGCGPGAIATKFIIPLLPSTFTKIMGVDISKKMIEYADLTFKHPKLSFRLMDIEDSDIKKYLVNENEKFDHISCFFLLHCLTDQETALKNIYNLLEPNGDCIFLFMHEHTIFDAYAEIKTHKKWQKYLSTLDNKLGYYCGKNVTDELTKFLNLAGFSDFKIDVNNSKFDFYDFENCKNIIKGIDPYIDHLPEDLVDEYLNDFLSLKFDEKETNCTVRFSLVTAYARK